MTTCARELPFDFYRPHSLLVQFSDLELSQGMGILLVRQADERLGASAGIAGCLKEWRDPAKVTYSLHQLVSQRMYQLIGGYEDVNNSNSLRQSYTQFCRRYSQWKTQQNLSMWQSHAGGCIPVLQV